MPPPPPPSSPPACSRAFSCDAWHFAAPLTLLLLLCIRIATAFMHCVTLCRSVCPPLETMTKAKTMTPYGCECKPPFERDHGHWGVCMCPKHLELSEDHKSCIERVNKIEIGIATEDEVVRKNRCSPSPPPHSHSPLAPHLFSRAQMHKFGRVASKTERLFRYDGPTIWGISNGGVTPEIQVKRGLGFCCQGLRVTQRCRACSTITSATLSTCAKSPASGAIFKRSGRAAEGWGALAPSCASA